MTGERRISAECMTLGLFCQIMRQLFSAWNHKLQILRRGQIFRVELQFKKTNFSHSLAGGKSALWSRSNTGQNTATPISTSGNGLKFDVIRVSQAAKFFREARNTSYSYQTRLHNRHPTWPGVPRWKKQSCKRDVRHQILVVRLPWKIWRGTGPAHE